MKLATRPMLTQSVTTAVLFATGDIMAQQAVERKGIEKHEFVRTGRMALYGGGKTSKRGRSVLEIVLIERNSDFWTCGNKMVQVSTDQSRVAKQEIGDCCTCWG